MIYGIIIIALAFAWLLYETRFLTIRLPYGESFLVNAMVAICIGTNLLPTLLKVVEMESKPRN